MDDSGGLSGPSKLILRNCNATFKRVRLADEGGGMNKQQLASKIWESANKERGMTKIIGA